MTGTLYAIVYLSQTTHRWSELDLTGLLTRSRKDNLRAGITGLLLYADGNFMQLLEGSRKGIDALMGRIREDERHRNISVLEEGPIAQRHFPEWSMAFLDFASPQVRALPGYSPFLETPFSAADLPEMGMDKVRLLHYFKSVMAASQPEVIALAEKVWPPCADSPGRK
jgi:hypothetical protein